MAAVNHFPWRTHAQMRTESSVCITIAAALRYKQTIYNEEMSIDYETWTVFPTRSVVVDIVAGFFVLFFCFACVCAAFNHIHVVR